MRFLHLALIAAIGFLSNHIVERVPVLLIEKNGKIVYSREILDRKFTLTFVHSVEKTPVYELYEIQEDGSLHLYETRYSSLGAGLPSDGEGGFEMENGLFRVKVSRVFKEISLRVSFLDGHGLIFENGETVMFKDIAEANEPLILFCKVLIVLKSRLE